MIGPDLSEFMRAQPSADVGFHTGAILSWDSATGENVVNVSGAAISDLPVLNIGDTTNLTVGDVVALIRYKTTYFILGRVVLPNSGAFATSAVSFEKIATKTASFALTTSDTTVISADVHVPAWANRALVHVNYHLAGRNSSGVSTYLNAKISCAALSISGTIYWNVEQVANTGYGTVSVAASAEESVTPGATVTVNGVAFVNSGPWAASSEHEAIMTGFAIYSRISV